MRVSRTANGYSIDADWLEQPVEAPTFEEAYWLALRLKNGS